MSRKATAVGRTVFYTGRVQGVGFRARAQSIARGFAVVGLVRNLPDGRVELYMEGAENEVMRCQAEIRRTMARFIQDEAFSDRPPTGRFTRFEIDY